MHGLSYSMAFLPRQGIEPVSPALAGRFLSLSYQWSPMASFLKEQKMVSNFRVQKYDRFHEQIKRSFWGIFSNTRIILVQFSSVQSLSHVQLLCDPMNHSTPDLPVHHQLLEFTQTHVHRVTDAIQLSHPLSSPSPPALNPSQHQSLFQWVIASHEVAKVLEFQPKHQFFQWTPRRTDLL